MREVCLTGYISFSNVAFPDVRFKNCILVVLSFTKTKFILKFFTEHDVGFYDKSQYLLWYVINKAITQGSS